MVDDRGYKRKDKEESECGAVAVKLSSNTASSGLSWLSENR